MARLLAIAWRERKRAPMHTLESAAVSVEAGVHQDFRGRPGARQVTLLSKRHWDAACAELGVALDWTARRANLLVDDLRLPVSRGARIAIGDVLLEVCTEVDPCERMDEASPGLRRVLVPDWRGGIGCRVLRAGEIRVGDSVQMSGPAND